MCVGYADLNKQCRKDPFPLPRIDQVVDSIVGCTLLSFLDCYSGYHQIALKKSDQEKTSVAKMASHAIFQYNVLAIDDTHDTLTNICVKMIIIRLIGPREEKIQNPEEIRSKESRQR